MNDLCGILLFLMLYGLPFVASVNLECRNHFKCANTTYFNICVDYGDGKLRAIESLDYPCPPGFVCEETNMHECQLPLVTTTILPSSTTTSLTDKRSTILNILGTITTPLSTQRNDNSDQVNTTISTKYVFTTEDNKIINENTTKDYVISTYLTTEIFFPMISNFTTEANLKNSTIPINTNLVKIIIETNPIVQSTKIVSNSFNNIPTNYSITSSAISDTKLSEKDSHMKNLTKIEPSEQIFNGSNGFITILNKTINNHAMNAINKTTVLAYEKHGIKINNISEKNGNTVNNDLFSSIKKNITSDNEELQPTHSPNINSTTEMGSYFLVDIPPTARINQTKDISMIMVSDHNINITHSPNILSNYEKLEKNNMMDIFFKHNSTDTTKTEKSIVFLDTTTEYITIVPATTQTVTTTAKNNFTHTNYLSPEIKNNDEVLKENAEVLRNSTVRMLPVKKTKNNEGTAANINIIYETTTETVINTLYSTIEQTTEIMNIFEGKNNDMKLGSNLSTSIEQIITTDNLTLTEFHHSLNYQMNKNISNPMNISTSDASSHKDEMIQNMYVINNYTTTANKGNIPIKEKQPRPTEEIMMFPLVITETIAATPSTIYNMGKESNNKPDNDSIKTTNSVIVTIDSSAANSNLSTERAEVLVRNSTVRMTPIMTTKVNEETSVNINSTYVMPSETGTLLTNSSNEQIMSIIDLLKDKNSTIIKDSAKDMHSNITKSLSESNTIKESNNFSSSIELMHPTDSLTEIKSPSYNIIKNISNPLTISPTHSPNVKDEKYYKFMQNMYIINNNTTTAFEENRTIKVERPLFTDAKKTFSSSGITGTINIIPSTKHNASEENNNKLNEYLMEKSNLDIETTDLSTEIPTTINNMNRSNIKRLIPEKNMNTIYQLEKNTEMITVNEDLPLSIKDIKVFNNISEDWTSINKSNNGEVQRSSSTDTTTEITTITITSVEQTIMVNSSTENINNIATEKKSVIINSDITDKYYEPRNESNKITLFKTLATKYNYSQPKPESKTATEHNASSTFIEPISTANNTAQQTGKANASVDYQINQNDPKPIYNLRNFFVTKDHSKSSDMFQEKNNIQIETTENVIKGEQLTTEGTVTYIPSVNTEIIPTMNNLRNESMNKLNNYLMTTTNTDINSPFSSIEVPTMTNVQGVMINNVNENTEYRLSNNLPKLMHNLTSKLDNSIKRTNINEDFPSSTVSNVFSKYVNWTPINKFNIGKVQTNTTIPIVSTIETITGIVNSDTEPKKTIYSLIENENMAVEKSLNITDNKTANSQRKNTENNFHEIVYVPPLTQDIKFNFSDGVNNQSNIFETSTQNSIDTLVDMTQTKLKPSQTNKDMVTEMIHLSMKYDDLVQNENNTLFKDNTIKDKQQSSNESINWMNISKATTPEIPVTPATIFNVNENSMNNSNTYLMTTTNSGMINFSTEASRTTNDDYVNFEFSSMQMGLMIKEIEEKSAKIQNTTIIKISDGTIYTIIDKKPYNGQKNNISNETENSNLDTTMTTLDTAVKPKPDIIKNKSETNLQQIFNFQKINHNTTLRVLTTKMPSFIYMDTTEKLNNNSKNDVSVYTLIQQKTVVVNENNSITESTINTTDNHIFLNNQPTVLRVTVNDNNCTVKNKTTSGSKSESTKVASENINSTEHKTDNFNTTVDLTKLTSLKIVPTIFSPEVLVNINDNSKINIQSKLVEPINRRIDVLHIINTTEEIENLEPLLKKVVVSVSSNASVDGENRTSHVNAENGYNTPILTKVEFTANRQNSDVEIFEKSFNVNYTMVESTTEKLLQKIVVTTNKIPVLHDKTIANETSKMHYLDMNDSQKFDCSQRGPGKYADDDDCRTFYICVSKLYSFVRKCQENTVFSDITKQCTKDLSHCIRKNEFQCPNVGRFNDIINVNYYYICVMDKQNKFVKFKFQCRDGFYLNISSVKCVPDDVTSILSPNDGEIESSESSTKTNDQSISGVRTEGDIRLDQNIHNQESSVIETFDCRYKNIGQYADSNDCKTYYVCTGKRKPVIRKCPEDTVFSELGNKCTKNLSHCIRHNEFICTSEGKFIDILNVNYYYICARHNVNHYLRFHLKCENGYDLDKSSIKCVQQKEKNTELYSVSELSIITSSEQDNGRSRKQRASRVSDFECKVEGKFSDPQNCKKFYVCSKKDGRFHKKKKKCKSEKVFHKDKKKCVSAESVDCN